MAGRGRGGEDFTLLNSCFTVSLHLSHIRGQAIELEYRRSAYSGGGKAFFKLGGGGGEAFFKVVGGGGEEFFQANILYIRKNECETRSII